MDDNQLKNLLSDQLEDLPQTVVDYIGSGNWKAPLNRLMLESNLSEDQQSALAVHFVNMLYGLEHPREFVYEITDDLKLPPEKIQDLAQKIDRFIPPAIMTELLSYNVKDEIAQESVEKGETKINFALPVEENDEDEDKETSPSGPLPIRDSLLRDIEHPKSSEEVVVPSYITPQSGNSQRPAPVGFQPPIKSAPTPAAQPNQTQTPNFMADKLKGLVTMPTKEEAQTAPMSPKSEPTHKGPDPYREPLS
jgi:hypothetical protein